MQKTTRLALFSLASLTMGGLIAIGGISYKAALNVLHPKRLPLANTPLDFGLPYEEVSFRSMDGTPLSGWFIPGKERSSIILAHGYASNKAEMLDYADFLHRGGFSLFLFDFRASGASSGSMATVGYHERGDLRAAIVYLRGRPELDPGRIGAMGVSMGAATVIITAAENTDLKAVVADSPFKSVDSVLGQSFERFFDLPRFPFAPLAIFLSEVQARINTSQVVPLAEVAKIAPRPLLIIHGEGDDTILPSDSQELFQAAGEPKELWLVPGAKHAEAHKVAKEAYEQRVLAFFQRYLD